MECVCGKQFTVDHALSCPCGALQSLCHNMIRVVKADLLNEVCHNVSTELQPLSGELLSHRTANTEDGARLEGTRILGRPASVRILQCTGFQPSSCIWVNSSFDCDKEGRDQPYKQVIGRMRSVLNISLLKLAIMCLHGA